ncbi:MAG: hypothetical protein PHW93_04660, partial [Candidatus Methanomethylophilaceae archaeon]|nr:hypothetical protein [Candidatus Methanomethylophilaceae archaeon]
MRDMNDKQRTQARWMAWVLVAIGPLSMAALLAVQGTDLDLVQSVLVASMILPTLFGLAVL